MAGVLLVRKLLPSLTSNEFSLAALRAALSPPYFIPSGTPLFQQLQLFQDNRQRIGLVVDEYGQVQGLVTLEDIIEEIVGEVATRTTASGGQLHWGPEGSAIVDGSTTLRDLNRRLSLELPLDGPKTLNGLLVEQLEEIPDAPCCVRFGEVLVEVLHVDEHAVRSARVARIGAPSNASATY
jgi:Mg2+/Co2+ transporter CorB